MLALLQRVKSAQVTVENKIIGQIQSGLLVFLGIEKEDTKTLAQQLAKKVISYRIFSDENDKMNRSLLDVKGELLVISQFTLTADTQKGLRPSFTPAALPDKAQVLYLDFIEEAKSLGIQVAQGEFGAKMEVSLMNDGPVTFLLKNI